MHFFQMMMLMMTPLVILSLIYNTTAMNNGENEVDTNSTWGKGTNMKHRRNSRSKDATIQNEEMRRSRSRSRGRSMERIGSKSRRKNYTNDSDNNLQSDILTNSMENLKISEKQEKKSQTLEKQEGQRRTLASKSKRTIILTKSRSRSRETAGIEMQSHMHLERRRSRSRSRNDGGSGGHGHIQRSLFRSQTRGDTRKSRHNSNTRENTERNRSNSRERQNRGASQKMRSSRSRSIDNFDRKSRTRHNSRDALLTKNILKECKNSVESDKWTAKHVKGKTYTSYPIGEEGSAKNAITQGYNKSIRPGQGLKERSGYSASIRPGGSITAGNSSVSPHPTGSIRPGTSGGSDQSGSQSLRQSGDPLTTSSRIHSTRDSSAVGAKIFVLAPNSYRSHFRLFMRLVEILLDMESVQEIHLLVPEYTSLNRQSTDPSSGGKLEVQYFNPYERRGGAQRRMTSSGKEWNRRNFQTDIRSNSGANLQLFFDLAEDKELITALAKKKFTFGIAELWDYGALHILWMLGIKNFVATQNMPLESIHYHYLGYLDKIMTQGDIPELWTAKYGDHRVRTSSTEFTDNFVAKVDVLRTEYNNMLHRFKQIFHTNYRMKTEVPRYSELFAKIRCIFVNTQPYLDFPMPPEYPQEIVHIGGILLDQRKHEATHQPAASSSTPADDDIESKAIAASRSKRGLILISFGSIINMEKIPDPAFDDFLALISAFPDYEFLWKLADPKKAHVEKLKGHQNVHIKAWLNQMALLENSQTKVFVSHCGINSVIEAVHSGIPLLCVPFMADQYYNSEALAKRNVAVVVNKDNLSNMERKMEQILDESYKRRMLEMRELLEESRPTARFNAEMQNLMTAN